MPPGKRGSAKKKKKKPKDSRNSPSSNATRGDSDDGESKSQQNSPGPVVKTDKREDNSSGNQSLTIGRTEEAAKETQSENGINRVLNSQKSHKKRNGNSFSNQSLTIDRTEEAAKEAHSEIEISRGSNSQKSHERSSISRSSRLNDKSNVDKKKAVVNLPSVVTHLVQPAKETKSEFKIDRGSNSHNSLEKNSSSRSSSSSNDKSRVDKKKTVVIQPAASVADLIQPAAVADLIQPAAVADLIQPSSVVADLIQPAVAIADLIQPAAVADLVQPIESLPENRNCKLGDLAVTGSPIVNLAKPVSSLVELASQVFDNTKLEDRNDLVVTETPLKQNNRPTSISEVVGSVPKENEVEKLVSSKSNDLPAFTNGGCPFCGGNITDRVNEPKTSEKQPLIDSAPRPAEKTSWKSCCGIFELCSGSSR